MADPGFPRGGTNLLFWQFYPEKCLTFLKKMEMEGNVSWVPLDSPMTFAVPFYSFMACLTLISTNSCSWICKFTLQLVLPSVWHKTNERLSLGWGWFSRKGVQTYVHKYHSFMGCLIVSSLLHVSQTKCHKITSSQRS